MTVGLKVANILWPVGTPGFFKAFFSTVAVRLEPDGWGTRFPAVMNELYQGEVAPERLADVRREVAAIREELRAHPPADVVWDFEDRTARPPWGDDIADRITDLATYFVTSDGRDLFALFDEAVDFASESGRPLRIQ